MMTADDDTRCAAPGAPPPGAPGLAPRRRRRGRRAFIAALILASAGLALAAAHRPLLVGFALLFRVDDPAPSDAIVMLLGGTPHRPQKAAELYRRGLAPVVLLCREPRDPVLPYDPSELIKQYMVRLGVPADAILILPGEIGSTRMEAQRVREYLDRHPDARRVTVVTTAFHTRRARWVFRRELRGRGVDVRAAAATDPAFDESDWYRTEDGLVLYFCEAIKTVYYWLKY
jgi:uncharacterized SAM-binding protein YcdF (DUF218 family)